jgi:ABC-type branched-subunit amino acid transport system ATPase component
MVKPPAASIRPIPLAADDGRAGVTGSIGRGEHGAGGLVVEDLTVRFGGATALDHVGLAAPAGRITGLIGPNGAGKTTTFNACSGLLRATSGRIVLFGRDVTRCSPAVRARAGLGRTFQRVELCDSLSVRDNVAVGVEARLAGGHPVRHLVAPAGQRREIAAVTDAALERCGLSPTATAPARDLSTGQRRLVELARVIAGGARMLLLDEPSSGLDAGETRAFAAVVADHVGSTGAGVLIVEHDMPLVLSICDHVHVLDFGRVIFSGPPTEVARSAAVRAAYLGDAPVAAGR